jgi:hypothetical protein
MTSPEANNFDSCHDLQERSGEPRLAVGQVRFGVFRQTVASDRYPHQHFSVSASARASAFRGNPLRDLANSQHHKPAFEPPLFSSGQGRGRNFGNSCATDGGIEAPDLFLLAATECHDGC